MWSADEYQYTSFGQLYLWEGNVNHHTQGLTTKDKIRKLLTKIYVILREFILSEGDHI